MNCPKCGAEMEWSRWQGPMGGWKCPECGLQIDKKNHPRINSKRFARIAFGK